jgi:hypothetical protein
MFDENPWELSGRAARRRRAGQLHGEVEAKARWGAAGWDTRAHTPAEKRPRLEGRLNAARDAPPRRLAQTRRGGVGVP